MKKIGFTVPRDRADTTLSGHFGVAKWLLFYESDERIEFARNRSLLGRSVAEAFKKAGCTDVVLTSIGPGALRRLQEAGIRAWYAPADVPVTELAARLERGELEEAVEAKHLGRRAHRRRFGART